MKRFRLLVSATMALVLALCTCSCNLFGRLDTPQDGRSKEAVAMALANQGLCKEAADLLVTIPDPSDNALVQLGWAYLCIAGATAATIADTIYSFSTDTNQLTLVGQLARKLVPMDGEKVTAIQNAMLTFTRIIDTRVDVELGIAYLVKSASILASQASISVSTVSLDRDDITGVACDAYASNCAAAVAADCTAGMTDSQVKDFSAFVSLSADRLSRAGVANLGTLANNLKAGVNAGAEFGRCFIRTQVVPQ